MLPLTTKTVCRNHLFTRKGCKGTKREKCQHYHISMKEYEALVQKEKNNQREYITKVNTYTFVAQNGEVVECVLF